MFKQSPSRNQRSKSFKIKHVLQICMLLAVCFWLLYQIKHSHDKKKEFDENGAKISMNTENGDEILKFGRKDLHPRVQETATNNEKHEEEEVEEEETGGGEEENKHEEEEQEEESKSEEREEREDEGRGGGDDELDELDQEKTEGEIDREEDFMDDEKEKEDDEGDEKGSEEKEGQIENESSLEDQDHDGSGRNTHEAREENYKGDDASSAVTHDTAETEKLSLESSNENKSNTTEEINADLSNSVLKEGEGEMAEDGNSLNVTASEEKGNEIISSKSGNSLLLNSTITTESNDQVEANNNSTEVSRETPLAVQNGTVTIPGSTQADNAMVDDPTAGKGSNLQTIVLEQTNNTTVSDGYESNSNFTITTQTEDTNAITRESSNSSVSEHDISEKIIISNTTAETDSSSESLTTKENDDATQNENSDPSKGMGTTEEGSDSSSTNENADAVHQDPNDSSYTTIPQEEKEARTDLDTLPEIRTEGSNTEDAAAE